MANTFTPVFTGGGSFAAEMVYDMTTYTIPDTIQAYIESVEIRHRAKFHVKMTGFESVKHVAGPTSGTDLLIDFAITFTGDLPPAMAQRLAALARGIGGAGMELHFRDDWIDNQTYSCRWVNAGDFVGNNPLHWGAAMRLEAWNKTAI